MEVNLCLRTVNDQLVVIFVLSCEGGPFRRHSSHLLCWCECNSTLDELEHGLFGIRRQILILVTAEELSLEEFLDSIREDISIADLDATINDRMTEVPFLRRRIGIEETDCTFHELPNRCEALLAVYTCTGKPLFLSVVDFDHLLLDIEDDWRNEVTH